MLIYIAKCNTSDPEIANSSHDDILGCFSTETLAWNAFIREEVLTEDNGESWVRKHVCFFGTHTIECVEIDKWFPLGCS